MLTDSLLDTLLMPVADIYEEFELSVIQDIARRIRGLENASRTAAWEVFRLNESGLVFNEIMRRLSDVTGRSERELRRMFERAGVAGLRFDDTIYRAAGMNPAPLNLSPAMQSALSAGLEKTGNVLRNMTLSTASTGQTAFIDAVDVAYFQVTTGTMDYNTAIRSAVKGLAASGLQVVQFSGRRDMLDVAVRRSVLTGVSQTVGAMQIARADEMNCDLVAVTAHIGARNKGVGPANHESWQGKVYSRSGTHPKYKPFVETTGYGTGAGLMGWNCRHNFYPFFEGLSENAYSQAELDDYAAQTVEYRGREMTFYDATQEQRAIERNIRRAKRESAALEAAGFDNQAELEAVRYYQSVMRKFIKETGLDRQRIREQI